MNFQQTALFFVATTIITVLFFWAYKHHESFTRQWQKLSLGSLIAFAVVASYFTGRISAITDLRFLEPRINGEQLSTVVGEAGTILLWLFISVMVSQGYLLLLLSLDSIIPDIKATTTKDDPAPKDKKSSPKAR